MKHSFPATLALSTVIVLLNATIARSQQVKEEIASKVSTKDSKKLTDANEIKTKGDLILSNSDYPGDAMVLFTGSGIDAKTQKRHIKNRYEASQYYKNANSLEFNVYQSNINEFWKSGKGDKQLLQAVIKVEQASIDSFKYAQKLRSEAEKKGKLEDRLPIIFKAEHTESNALNNLAKVLYTYLNWPAKINESWFSGSGQNNATENKNVTMLSETKPKQNITTETKNLSTQSQQKPRQANLSDNSHASTGDSSLYSEVQINEDQIDQFNEFLQKTYPSDYENYVINFQNLDYSDIQSLRNAWDKYRYGGLPGDSLAYLAEKSNVSVDTIAQPGNEPLVTQNIPVKNVAETPKSEKTTSKVTNKNEPKQNNVAVINEPKTEVAGSKKTSKKTEKEVPVVAESKTATANTKPAASEASKNIPKADIPSPFQYMVQVAACKVPLDDKTIKGIYNGPEMVSESYEDGWYKYIIGKFSTYSSARSLRDQTKVPGAFVIAYLNGKRIKITPASTGPRTAQFYAEYSKYNPENIVFRLQIAASKIKLSQQHLKNIYDGPVQIDERYEDGWFRYSLRAGKNIEEARVFTDKVNIPGSFITAYHLDEKIDLMVAIKLTTKHN